MRVRITATQAVEWAIPRSLLHDGEDYDRVYVIDHRAKRRYKRRWARKYQHHDVRIVSYDEAMRFSESREWYLKPIPIGEPHPVSLCEAELEKMIEEIYAIVGAGSAVSSMPVAIQHRLYADGRIESRFIMRDEMYIPPIVGQPDLG